MTDIFDDSNPKKIEYLAPEYSADQLRVLALQLAVQYLGSVNSNPKATPTGPQKVLQTAQVFYQWMDWNDFEDDAR